MIWFLLYPFRGTTETPVLHQDHPIRKAFTQYGYNVARHPRLTLLMSIAVSVVLVFPFPFLYTNNFTNGSSNLPHHVWTSAQPFQGPMTTLVDVVMRSVWVHGSYMKALETNILKSALEIQDHLLGPTVDFDPQKSSNRILTEYSSANLPIEVRDILHATNGISNQSWFFHSPLLYWSCSMEKIGADTDILTTINQSLRKATTVNVTLRHSIVFSGKRFEDHRLVASDALVITLIHMLDSPVGRHWERKAQELAKSEPKKWRLYPPDGRSLGSTLYEFRFQPLSLKDDLILTAAYVFTFIYVMINFSRIQAFRSRIALTFAVMAQIGIPIVASFTVCAVFKVDLSKIPREAYPLVVPTIGIRNVSRLMNAIIVTRSEDSTSARISEALGKTSHLALSGLSQNLAILWILSRGIYPQITAFCIFAAVALVFDFFFLLTFFSAILSIDIKRIELSDALKKAVAHNGRRDPPLLRQGRFKWPILFFRRLIPFSSRIAGTIFLIGFALIAHWHFFDYESISQIILHIAGLTSTHSQSTSLLSVDIHQARTPTAWLRMQDHQTAQEVIQIVKPYANSYIARVYDPLVFVLNGSDRTPNESGIRPLLPAAYDFMKHQLGYFLFTIFTVVASVSLFLNILLHDETVDHGGRDRSENEQLISLITLSRGHTLDIVLLTTSKEGILVTVGLDRKIIIWNISKQMISHLVYEYQKPLNPFPVLAIAVNNSSDWLAILSAKDKLFLWNISEQKWGPSIEVQVQGLIPIEFFFRSKKSGTIDPLVLVRQNGLMSELYVEEQKEIRTSLSHEPLVFTRRLIEIPPNDSNPKFKLFFTSRDGCMNVASPTEIDWHVTQIDLPRCSNDGKATFFLPLPSLAAILAVRENFVDLIDLPSHEIIHTFCTEKIQTNSLRCFHSSRRRPQCGSIGLRSLTIAYNCAETGNCIMQIYLPQPENDMICLRKASSSCCFIREAVEQRFETENPGQWEALQSGYLVGIRKRDKITVANNNNIALDIGQNHRRRNASATIKSSRSPKKYLLDQELWEVWAISSRGQRYSRPLFDPMEQDYLLVNSLGPLQTMGKRSIIVSFGRIVKAISIGKESFNGDSDSNNDTTFLKLAAARIAKRKKPHISKKKYHSS